MTDEKREINRPFYVLADDLVRDWHAQGKMPPIAWEFREFAEEAAKRATDQLSSDLAKAREQIAFFKTCGIIELAIRNPNISSYINEWEGRAERAEQQVAEYKKATFQ